MSPKQLFQTNFKLSNFYFWDFSKIQRIFLIWLQDENRFSIKMVQTILEFSKIKQNFPWTTPENVFRCCLYRQLCKLSFKQNLITNFLESTICCTKTFEDKLLAYLKFMLSFTLAEDINCKAWIYFLLSFYHCRWNLWVFASPTLFQFVNDFCLSSSNADSTKESFQIQLGGMNLESDSWFSFKFIS